jgi:hypothetical protein
MLFEFSLSGKWLELLKQIAPGVWSVGLHPIRGAVVRGRGELKRNRVQHNHCCGWLEWRPDRGGEPVDAHPSRFAGADEVIE